MKSIALIVRTAAAWGAARSLGMSFYYGLFVVRADGSVMAAFVMIADITRHRQAERAVRESEERLAKFMQASVEGIIFHRDGVVSDANAALLSLLNAPFEAVVGRHILDFVAPAHRARAQAVMAAGRDVNYEIDVLDSGGQVLQVEVMGRTITRRGESLRMVIVRDIRARLAAQARRCWCCSMAWKARRPAIMPKPSPMWHAPGAGLARCRISAVARASSTAHRAPTIQVTSKRSTGSCTAFASCITARCLPSAFRWVATH